MIDRPSPARVRLLPQSAVRTSPLWPGAFASLAKDHRYHELVADTLGFECHVLAIEDQAGILLALQPCFFVVQDILATAPKLIRHLARGLRRFWPRLLKARILMIGCPAGAGDLVAGNHLELLRDALPQIAREQRASLIVWKDIPATHRASMEPVRALFPRLASMPATTLPLNYSNFDDYLARALSHSTRKNLRRKFRASPAIASLEMTVSSAIGDVLDEAHSLYLQVFNRSTLQFEKLTREFLLGLEERLGDRIRFFRWHLNGCLVAFSICLVHDGTIYDEYLGLDYRVALDLHLYFVTFRDILSWAIDSGLRTYYSTPLNYEPKLRLGFQLAPLDLFVAPAAAWSLPLLRLALPLLTPSRVDPALERFRNAAEMA